MKERLSTVETSSKNCYFCHDLSAINGDPFFHERVPERSGQSRLLSRTDNLWCFPDMSPIAENHLLVAPINHVTSFAQLSKEDSCEFGELCNEIRKRYGVTDLLIFEHGMGLLGDNNEPCGNSVYHAHIHVIPVVNEAVAKVFPEIVSQANESFGDRGFSFEVSQDAELPLLLKSYTQNYPYLFVRIGNKCVVYPKTSDIELPSQFLRKVCAETINGQGSFWNRKDENEEQLKVLHTRLLRTYENWFGSENVAPNEPIVEFNNLSLEHAKYLIDHFNGYRKLQSILVLKALDFPISDGVVISRFDKHVHNALIQKYPEQVFGLRTDKKEETLFLPRGGYDVDVKDLDRVLPKIVGDGRIAILLKNPPGELPTRYDHIYSMNMYVRDGYMQIEIVGKGFDTSDLNRGDNSPHQVYEIPLEYCSEDISPLQLFRFQTKVVSEKEYRESVQNRLAKIGRGLTEGRSEELSQEEAISAGKQFLLNKEKTLLIDNNSEYIPINYYSLHKIIKKTYSLTQCLPIFEFRNTNFVIGCSIYNSGRIKYWDIVYPDKKFMLR